MQRLPLAQITKFRIELKKVGNSQMSHVSHKNNSRHTWPLESSTRYGRCEYGSNEQRCLDADGDHEKEDGHNDYDDKDAVLVIKTMMRMHMYVKIR